MLVGGAVVFEVRKGGGGKGGKGERGKKGKGRGEERGLDMGIGNVYIVADGYGFLVRCYLVSWCHYAGCEVSCPFAVGSEWQPARELP